MSDKLNCPVCGSGCSLTYVGGSLRRVCNADACNWSCEHDIERRMNAEPIDFPDRRRRE